MDASFGGALQILDKSLRAVSLGIKRLYYHQGTINQGKNKFLATESGMRLRCCAAFFNWWSSEQVEYPYYGGFLSTLALQDADHIIAIDDGQTPYAQYVLYRKGRPFKAVLINTVYYSGEGERSETAFTLTGIKPTSTPRAIRVTAGSADTTATTAKDAPETQLTFAGMFVKMKCVTIMQHLR
jgi:hypothetical protein